MKISEQVLSILDAAIVDGNSLILQGELDRQVYAAVNKVLEAIGGKWSRKHRAHLFPGPAAEVLNPILETGEYSRVKQDLGQFDSPPPVVERVISLARLEVGHAVLEPSAGIGNIARAAAAVGADVYVVEIDPRRYAELSEFPRRVNDDFLRMEPTQFYDRVVMNPPFAGQADIDHVLHAFQFLKDGGRLVSVMSGGVLFRNNRKATDFRRFVDRYGASFSKLPTGAFASSGTDVHSCILTLVKT